MAICKGCSIDRHFLGNTIRNTTMSKLIVPVIALSQEKVVYIKTSELNMNRSGGGGTQNQRLQCKGVLPILATRGLLPLATSTLAFGNIAYLKKLWRAFHSSE
jgi:hypothetical protein